MINTELVGTIVTEICLLEEEYQQNQGMILTEDDLKCHLFSRLKAVLPQRLPTINRGVTGSPLHSEVKFFDEHGKLTMIPDITIISPDHLSIFHSVEFRIDNNTFGGFKRYSSKSFEIGGNAIIIELKFCRAQIGLTRRHIISYQQDIDKILRLQELMHQRSQGRDKLFGICAVFNKTDLGKDRFNTFLENNNSYINLEVVYKTGRVNFSNVNTSLYGYVTEKRSIC